MGALHEGLKEVKLKYEGIRMLPFEEAWELVNKLDGST